MQHQTSLTKVHSDLMSGFPLHNKLPLCSETAEGTDVPTADDLYLLETGTLDDGILVHSRTQKVLGVYSTQAVLI